MGFPAFTVQLHKLMLSIFLGIFLVLSGPAQAHEQAPHVHGVGQLNIALDTQEVAIMFVSPLDNLLGFEHAPRTDHQRQLAHNLLQRLERFDQLVQPDPQGACTLQTVTVDADILTQNHRTTHSAQSNNHDHAHEDRHSDLALTAIFKCERAAEITYLETSLFETFPGLERLNVQIAGPTQQSGLILQSGNKRIEWLK